VHWILRIGLQPAGHRGWPGEYGRANPFLRLNRKKGFDTSFRSRYDETVLRAIVCLRFLEGIAMKHLTAGGSAFLFACLFVSVAGAADAQSVASSAEYARRLIDEGGLLAPVNYYGDKSQFVAEVSDDYLCGISQGRLKVFSKSDVEYISSYYLTPSRILRTFEFYDGCVYLPCGYKGISVFDVREPGHIRLVGQIELSHGGYGKIEIRDGVLFAPDSKTQSLVVLSLENPQEPVEISRCVLGKEVNPQKVFVTDDIVYVQGTKMLVAVDCSDITSCAVLGRVEIKTRSSVGGVVVKDSYAYLFTSGELRIYDVAKPDEMKAVGAVKATWCCQAVLRGEHIFGFGDNGVYVYDLTDPLKPELVRRCFNGVPGHFLVGSRADWVVGNSGRVEKSVGLPYFSGLSGRFGFEADNVVAGGDYLYVFGEGGLHVLDISSPTEPKEIGSLKISSFFRSTVLLRDDYLYTPLGIIDVSNPRKCVQTCRMSGAGRALALFGDFLFRSTADGIDIYDVSDVSKPKVLKSMSADEEVRRIVIDKGIVYLGLEKGLIRSCRLDEQFNLVTLDQVQLAQGDMGITMDMCVEGQLLYVALNGDGIASIDISDPEDLRIYSRFNTSQFSEQIKVVNGYAYVADGSGGTLVIDMATKGYEKLLASYQTTDWTRSLDIQGNYVYTSEGDNGIGIFVTVPIER